MLVISCSRSLQISTFRQHIHSSFRECKYHATDKIFDTCDSDIMLDALGMVDAQAKNLAKKRSDLMGRWAYEPVTSGVVTIPKSRVK